MATQISTLQGNSLALVTGLDPAWFAVHTSSRHEKQVARQLEGRCIDHFLPLYEESHRWADRIVSVQLPLFAGYLFVNISLQRRMDVLQVPGVARLVGFGATAQAIDSAEIESLQRGIFSGLVIEPHPYLKVGARVRVRSGPMKGAKGVLVRMKGSPRVVISVDLIMRSVAVEIDIADIQPC